MLVKTITSLFVKIIFRPPLTLFNKIKYVRTLLLQDYRSELDRKRKMFNKKLKRF